MSRVKARSPFEYLPAYVLGDRRTTKAEEADRAVTRLLLMGGPVEVILRARASSRSFETGLLMEEGYFL
jgi:hypothetical protein